MVKAENSVAFKDFFEKLRDKKIKSAEIFLKENLKERESKQNKNLIRKKKIHKIIAIKKSKKLLPLNTLKKKINSHEKKSSEVKTKENKKSHLSKEVISKPKNLDNQILENKKIENKKITKSGILNLKIKKKIKADRKINLNLKNLNPEKFVDEIKEICAEEEHLDVDEKKLQEEVFSSKEDINKLKKEISKVVTGYENIVDGIIRSVLANGHVLVEGVPGTAKTLLIKTISVASGCSFSRIQFTVDLLPTDITGVTTYDEINKKFSTYKGPIFANFIIADEINRAPPKTQSAMLEAMQEKQVTIGKETFKLPLPFFVMANKNPLESAGTYNLPEAQIDRFLFKLVIGYLSSEEEITIIDKNTTLYDFDKFNVCPVTSPSKIINMQEVVKRIIISQRIKKYIVKLVEATRYPDKYGIKLGKYIEWGCSPRASIGLSIAAKADAFMNGSIYVTPQNVKNVIHDVFRHRIILNYLGQAEKINSDSIITEILDKIPLP